ncbi:TIGR04442 family protein [Trichlorobacter thiogenes]|uniref:TIGR04442 family protein n=1 Tax=Trichlorobacter thiogenes TaxID=115783 RepID=A0A1T4ME69_9BACT|nr:TIGR04442 family protein [Trichlorobacter thiogenes]SJZ65185.1 TIGR04442 family protein [Trichlorobacter thiogenes]
MIHHPNQLSPEEAQELLKQLVLLDGPGSTGLSRLQVMQLLCARKRALAAGDQSFDGLLFELGKQLDEQIRDGAPLALKKRFTLLTDYFQRLELATGHLNHLAFMGSSQLDLELLVELKHDMEWFESIDGGLFARLMVDDLLKSQLLDSYGRRRVKLLVDGLARIQTVQTQKNDMKFFDLQAVQGIIYRLQQLEKEERLFMLLAEIVAEQSKLNQAAMSTPQGQEVIRRVTTIELRQRHGVEGDIPDALFQKAFELVKLEAIYSNAILPQVVRGNAALRQDFIEKSGLDLFYIEDLEDQYCSKNRLSSDMLKMIRSV